MDFSINLSVKIKTWYCFTFIKKITNLKTNYWKYQQIELRNEEIIQQRTQWSSINDWRTLKYLIHCGEVNWH